ncbi:hypothetical protein B9Z55_016642 [Caenorhabditis nigoni]|uniref:DUF38 domain-containing protein n=1 Tax=Caenorhabditis nigoni TaxID=1611254 RepID=A0A2G5T5X0_9PELO|nr:hypothetical protein B9Z55_016642 [Caenorhabditis nigoni]
MNATSSGWKPYNTLTKVVHLEQWKEAKRICIDDENLTVAIEHFQEIPCVKLAAQRDVKDFELIIENMFKYGTRMNIFISHFNPFKDFSIPFDYDKQHHWYTFRREESTIYARYNRHVLAVQNHTDFSEHTYHCKRGRVTYYCGHSRFSLTENDLFS